MQRCSKSRIDLRCITIFVTIVIVLIFYILVSQYDDSLFNPDKVSNGLNEFISNNHLNLPQIKTHSEPNIPIIPLSIADRVNLSYVVVGYCCQFSFVYQYSLIIMDYINNI